MNYVDLVYKVDYLVQSIEFSYVNPNTRFFLLINSKVLSL